MLAVIIGCQKEQANPAPELISLDVKLSASFDKAVVTTDSLLTMSFVWETLGAFSPIDRDLWASVQFRDSSGKLLWGADHVPDTPTSKWRPSQLVNYNRTIYVPPALSETVAHVLVGLYDPKRPIRRFVISSPEGVLGEPWLSKVGEVEVKPRPSLLESPSRANIMLESGFYPVEREDGDQWRWTLKEARLKLQNLGERGMLFLEGEVNLECLNSPPTITITIGGKERGSFSPNLESGRFQRKVVVQESDFGDKRWLDVLIETSETFVPSQHSATTDSRELGIKLRKIYFAPAGQ